MASHIFMMFKVYYVLKYCFSNGKSLMSLTEVLVLLQSEVRGTARTDCPPEVTDKEAAVLTSDSPAALEDQEQEEKDPKKDYSLLIERIRNG